VGLRDSLALAKSPASITSFGLFTRASEVPEIKVMPIWRIPWLSQIDFFGRALFSQTPAVYIAFGLVPVFWFLLFRTQWGLRVRSTGENPAAAESAGINVWNIRLGDRLNRVVNARTQELLLIV
jgi:ABC-type uncharacterized transport system permease subunit